jgi:hypothetical protein
MGALQEYITTTKSSVTSGGAQCHAKVRRQRSGPHLPARLVLALLAGHELAHQKPTFNSYQFEEGWLRLPEGRSLGLASKAACDRDGFRSLRNQNPMFLLIVRPSPWYTNASRG